MATGHAKVQFEILLAAFLADPAGVGGGLAGVGGGVSVVGLGVFLGDWSFSLIGSAALLAAALPFLAGVETGEATAFPFSACLLPRVVALVGV